MFNVRRCVAFPFHALLNEIKKSWLKFGSLPTQCLPQKSCQKVVLKRKSPLKLNPPIVSKKKHCKNLNDISQDFNLCKTSSQWQQQTILMTVVVIILVLQQVKNYFQLYTLHCGICVIVCVMLFQASVYLLIEI